MANCTTCRCEVSESMRRDMGCGWFARTPGEYAGSVPFRKDVEGLEVCAGFTAELADVVDTSEVWADWDKGGYDREPSTALRTNVRILNGAVHTYRAAKEREAMQRGGGGR